MKLSKCSNLLPVATASEQPQSRCVEFKLNTLNTYTSQNVNTILCLPSNTHGSKYSRPIQKHFVPASNVLPIHLRWRQRFSFPFRLWSFLTSRLRLLALHLEAELWIQLSAAPSSFGCVTHQPVDDKTSTKNIPSVNSCSPVEEPLPRCHLTQTEHRSQQEKNGI